MRQSGKRAYEAAIEAADEIGLAVVATTGTIVAVFVPVAFMPGIPGQFFKDFAIATCVSVVFSLLVARMLTPLMGAYLVKAGRAPEEDDAELDADLPLPPARRCSGTAGSRWSPGIAFFVGSMSLATLLPSDFMPATDRGRSLVSVELPPGSTLAETDAVVRRITARLGDEPEVREHLRLDRDADVTAGMGPGGPARPPERSPRRR